MAAELYEEILILKKHPALVGGIIRFRDGSMQFSGTESVQRKSVWKLVDAVDGDLSELIARYGAAIDISKNHHSFSGINNDMDGQVKFIYKTDVIESL